MSSIVKLGLKNPCQEWTRPSQVLAGVTRGARRKKPESYSEKKNLLQHLRDAQETFLSAEKKMIAMQQLTDSEQHAFDAYVEVKSVTLSRQAGLAEFPDSVTARGRKHLLELAEMARAGHRAVMLFLVQRTDCADVTLAADIDPAYAAAFAAAREAGVETICLGCAITPAAVEVAGPLAFTPVAGS